MSNLSVPKIGKGFVNKNGDIFPDVREIAFLSGQLNGNLGKLVAESNKCSHNYFVDSDIGVYIYKSSKPCVGYRIYKCFADYGFNGYRDEVLIQSLSERSKNIKSVSFPMGVVTLDGRVIGQEIPFFSCSCTLYDFINSNLNINPTIYYKLVLKSIKEMYDNGIIYSDLHSNNFMVYLCKLGIEVIDFELSHIKFDDFSVNSRIDLLERYKRMIINLNSIIGIDYDLISVDNFNDMDDQLYNMNKVLKKSTRFV